ncbi:MAG: hypothetical protein IJ395_05095 [Clostridia bacterium]|nr:hypothetical protein [Clostridia bacterium]
MLEIIFSILAIWLFFKAIGLAFKITWGAAKIVATILLAIAVPVFILLAIFVGGFVLLVPVALIAGAVGLLKVCG